MRITLAFFLAAAALAPGRSWAAVAGNPAAPDDDAAITEGTHLGNQLYAQYTKYQRTPAPAPDMNACSGCLGYLQEIDECARVNVDHLRPKQQAPTCDGSSSDPSQPASCSIPISVFPYDKIAFAMRKDKACRKALRKIDAKPVKEAPAGYADCRTCYEPQLRQNRLTAMKRAYDRLSAAMSAKKGVRAAVEDVKARAACDWLCAPK